MKTLTEMTSNDKQNFRPTPEMVAAAKAVFTAMAWVGVVKPMVIEYQTDILNKHQWHIAKKWIGRTDKEDRIILDPDHSYLLEDTDFDVYLQECREARRAAKLQVTNEDYCPLLVAEHALVQVERVLIEVMQPITTIDPDDVYGDNRRELIDLTLRWLAPYVK